MSKTTPAASYLPPLEGVLFPELPPEIIEGLNQPLERFVLLTLPFPPSANRYWRHYRGITVRSEEADNYIAKVATYCNYKQIEPLEGDLKALFYFYRYNAARDLNNCIKVLEDALQGYAYLNDNQIADSRQIRDYDNKKPRAIVLISPTVARDAGKIKSRQKRDFTAMKS